MDCKVIDNFLPQDIFNDIQKLLISDKFGWFYCDAVGNPLDDEDDYYIHHFYEDGKIHSLYFEKVMIPILCRLSLPFNNLDRARANMYTKKEVRFIHDLHNDSDDKHVVGLFSLNTNNGFTMFDDGRRFKSIANRMLIFDGSQRHCSVTQTDTNIRYNININFI